MRQQRLTRTKNCLVWNQLEHYGNIMRWFCCSKPRAGRADPQTQVLVFPSLPLHDSPFAVTTSQGTWPRLCEISVVKYKLHLFTVICHSSIIHSYLCCVQWICWNNSQWQKLVSSDKNILQRVSIYKLFLLYPISMRTLYSEWTCWQLSQNI